MHFYEALKFILTTHAGVKVARKKWNTNEKEARYICKGMTAGKYHIDYVYSASDYKKVQSYTPSQEDMIEEDWYILEGC